MVKENDLQQLRSFYEEVELNVESLVILGVAVESFGTLVSTVVIDKLPSDAKLVIARHIYDTLNKELKAHKTVNVEVMNVDSDEVLSFTGSLSRGKSHQSMKCCFCEGSSSESFQNTEGNIKTSKQAVSN